MKKLLAFVVMLIIALTPCAMAENTDGIAQTTDKTICFYGIPWDIDINAFKEAMAENNLKYSECRLTEYGGSSYGIKNIFSSSFGDGEIIDVFYSDFAETMEYKFDNDYSIGSYADHQIALINTKFYKYNASLYSVDILISSNKQITERQQFDDLKSKLSYTYGIPYTYSTTMDFKNGNDNVYEYCVWVGSDKTAVYLEISMCTNQSGEVSEYVSVCYGKYDSYDVIERLDAECLAKEESRKNDALNKMQNDYSGL